MYRVLLVDDEPMILKGLKKIVLWEEYGMEIAGEAINGMEAVKIIENTRINIIITDIKMPNMDGLELITYIRERNLDIKCIVLSGYDEFEFVKETVKLGIENYVLKPVNVDELRSTLANTAKKIENELYKQIEARERLHILKNNILYRWVHGDIGNDELMDRASLLNIRLDGDKFLVAIVKVLHITSDHAPKIQEKTLLRFAIQNICDEITNWKFTVITFCDMNGDIIIIFNLNDDNNCREDLYETLSILNQRINELLNTKVFITVGSREDEFQNLHLSYSHASKLQEYCLISPPSRVVFHDDIAYDELLRQKDWNMDINKLNGYITTKNKIEAIKFIETTYDRLQKTSGLTPSHIQSLTIEILFTITKAIKANVGNSDTLFDNYKSLFNNIFEMNTLKDIKKWLEGIVVTCIDFLDSENEKLSPITNQALKYIQANYATGLNLKTISSDLNISPAYLGYLFNKEIGDTFTNYLNKIRIDKAKELLLTTSLKANEISEKVGYPNISYFSTVFKKLTSMSPSECRGK